MHDYESEETFRVLRFTRLEEAVRGQTGPIRKREERGAAFEHPDTGANMYQLTTFTQEHPHHHFGSYD